MTVSLWSQSLQSELGSPGRLHAINSKACSGWAEPGHTFKAPKLQICVLPPGDDEHAALQSCSDGHIQGRRKPIFVVGGVLACQTSLMTPPQVELDGLPHKPTRHLSNKTGCHVTPSTHWLT